MDNRIVSLNFQNSALGSCVIYFASRDLRVADNYALLAAQEAALRQNQPLVVCFVLDISINNRYFEHYQFLLDGLEEFARKLNDLQISFILKLGDREEESKRLISELKPSAVYFDFSPLNRPRNIQKNIANNLSIPAFVVDTHNIVPIWVLSDKEEYAAHTIRSKVYKNLEKYLQEPSKVRKHLPELRAHLGSIDFSEAKNAIKILPKNGINITFRPGEDAAMMQLEKTLGKIKKYALDRNNPNIDAQTNLSPYLHYGFIYSLRVVLELMRIMDSPPILLKELKLASHGEPVTIDDSCNALIEEIVVRKELSDNFCFYNRNYNNIKAAKSWAFNSLLSTETDIREHLYSLNQFENSETHDPAWNAAQNQLKYSGKMHGYMRMYWAKKILEWSESAEEAMKIAIYLNDKYSLDGGDPNGYTGIAWSIIGIHDRPWFERPVFGKIRYMNYAGLRRKFDIENYEKKWNHSSNI